MAKLSSRFNGEYQDGTLYPFKWALPIKAMVGFGVLIGTVLPQQVSAAIAAMMMAGTVSKAILSMLNLYTDPLSKRVVPGRKTALIKGDFVVFHIGSRPNRHIDGFYKWMGEAMGEMQRELEDNPELGCLGSESFVGTTGTLLVQYWASLDDLNAYARSMNNKHSGPWAKLMAKGRHSQDYGFWHEAFEVKAGKYDAIYVNCPPMLLGNCTNVDLAPCEGRMKSAAGRAGKTDGADYAEDIGKPDY